MKQKQSHKKRWLVVIIAAVFALSAAGCLAYRHYHHKKIPAISASQNTKGETTLSPTAPSSSSSGNSTPSTSSPTASTEPGDNKANTGGTTTAPTTTLVTPTGVFVSNHHPNLSGQPAPNQINSSCSTTSGATCQIIFTKDGVTKSLPAQVTDRGGSTYWNGWKLQDVGLTVGAWHIQAKATLGSQVTTADDGLTLDVQP